MKNLQKISEKTKYDFQNSLTLKFCLKRLKKYGKCTTFSLDIVWSGRHNITLTAKPFVKPLTYLSYLTAVGKSYDIFLGTSKYRFLGTVCLLYQNLKLKCPL